MAHEGLIRVVAYLEAVLAERLAEVARSEGRSVSKEVSRRLEASFGSGPSFVIGKDAVRRVEKAFRKGDGKALADAVNELGVPPETPPVEPRAAVVERLQQQVPGVQTGAAFPARSNDLAGAVRPKPRRTS